MSEHIAEVKQTKNIFNVLTRNEIGVFMAQMK